ncbi:hypothetical protein BFS30_07175 [Pedobacter steynii]|uniref:Uncharacterized protein n=1 Tax=Pedobacter steynii TaxID=430522 RepID=A0A1D7QE97_9SPHI|nr:hypothetical protein BFS30_07175 [Pedobacter steynii]
MPQEQSTNCPYLSTNSCKYFRRNLKNPGFVIRDSFQKDKNIRLGNKSGRSLLKPNYFYI